MNLIEIFAYVAVGAFFALRIAMLAAFVLLPVAVFRMVRHSAVPHRAPAAK